MNQEAQLKLQAYLDGELSGREAREIAAYLAEDVAARQLRDELAMVRTVLREQEPEYKLPESREFYWSKIQRAMAQSEPAPAGFSLAPFLAWRKYLAPIAGMALVAFLAVGIIRTYEPGRAGEIRQHLAEVENLSEEVGSFSFRSPSENVFVVWLYDKSRNSASDTDAVIEDWIIQ